MFWLHTQTASALKWQWGWRAECQLEFEVITQSYHIWILFKKEDKKPRKEALCTCTANRTKPQWDIAQNSISHMPLWCCHAFPAWMEGIVNWQMSSLCMCVCVFSWIEKKLECTACMLVCFCCCKSCNYRPKHSHKCIYLVNCRHSLHYRHCLHWRTDLWLIFL